MLHDDLESSTQRVRKLYETLPYPQRNPADESSRLQTTALDELATLNHFCFQGRCDFRNKFRILVAGGGTGDATIYLAQQLRDTDAEIVHVDLSRASLEIAYQRAEIRGLEKRIQWLEGSLVELAQCDMEPFDYINASGVLHHLENPAEGLLALKSMLQPAGALGIMVYGRYGRTGTSQVRNMLQIIDQDSLTGKEQINRAKTLLSSLPPLNCYSAKDSKFTKAIARMDDAEFVDTFLHPQESDFTVPELYDLLTKAELQLIAFHKDHRMLYDPQFAFQDPALLASITELDETQQQALTELFWGTLAKHTFWAGSSRDCSAQANDPEMIPQFSHEAMELDVPRSIIAEQGESWGFHIQRPDGIRFTLRIHADSATKRFIQLIDGTRTMGEIIATLHAECQPKPAVEDIWKICLSVLKVLMRRDFVLLRHKDVVLPGSMQTSHSPATGNLQVTAPLPNQAPSSVAGSTQQAAIPAKPEPTESGSQSQGIKLDGLAALEKIGLSTLPPAENG